MRSLLTFATRLVVYSEALFMGFLGEYTNRHVWIRQFRQNFWRFPDRMMALKVVISMAVLSIPFILMGKPFYGVTLALGAWAGALSETDDHPKGRMKALLLSLVSFTVSSFSVGFLQPYPIVLGAGFVVSTIVFILIGGLGERYRGITFGAILVGIYTLIGINHSPDWYMHAILLPSGALLYGLVSLILLFYKPYRLLEEQLARGFLALSDYLQEKSRLFPLGNKQEQEEIGRRLAVLNIQLVSSLEKCKAVLNSYSEEVDDQSELTPYLQRFMLLQSLHERAASTHQRYDVLNEDESNNELLSGVGELLHQLSHATYLVADNMLTGAPYRHPQTIEWMLSALEVKLENSKEEAHQTLLLLLHNLTRSHVSLKNLNQPTASNYRPRLGQDKRSLWERLKAQLSFSHPRLRYAIRLSTSFLVGYIIVQFSDMDKGAWIMLTSLFVSQMTYSETRKRLFQRILGTVSGIVFGTLLLQIFPTLPGRVILMLGAGFLFFSWLRKNYSIAVVYITIFVLSSNSFVMSSSLDVMIPRVLDTIVGAFLAFLSIRLLWPNWQYKRLPQLLSSALLNNAQYFSQILKEYDHKEQDDYDYRLARRLAHKSDNELTLAWQSMRLEPKRKQKLLQHAYVITYLNHALLSYLSAFASRREAGDSLSVLFQEEALVIEKAIQEIGAILANPSEQIIESDLKSVLMVLRDQIRSSEIGLEREQLRLLYNIADVGQKLLEESVVLNKFWSVNYR